MQRVISGHPGDLIISIFNTRLLHLFYLSFSRAFENLFHVNVAGKT